MDLGAALLALVITMGLKLPVMIVTGWLMYKMYKATNQKSPKKLWILVPEEERAEYKILFYSLTFFALSEIFCGIETYILMQSHYLGRFLHSITSGVGMGLFAVGIYKLVDKKAFNFTGDRCFFKQGVCKGCPLTAGKSCRFTPTILYVATFILLAAIPPFFASTQKMVADPTKFILPFEILNNWYDNSLIPFIMKMDPNYKPIGVAFFLTKGPQVLDFKIIPGIVILLQLTGIALIQSGKISRIKQGMNSVLFGLGLLCYTYYEVILNRLTDDLFVGALGHEIGEFVFLILLSEFVSKMFPVKHKVK